MGREREIGEYIVEREGVIRMASGLVEDFSSVLLSQTHETAPVSTVTKKVVRGMGRSYNVVESTWDAGEHLVTHTSFLLSPHRRSLLRFTDPVYEIEYAAKGNEAQTNVPRTRVRLMGNGEIEIGYSPTGYEARTISSWRCNNTAEFLDELQNPEFKDTLALFGLCVEVDVENDKVTLVPYVAEDD